MKSRDPALLKQFKKYRNSLTNQLRAARDAYFMGMFSDPANQRSDIIWRKLNVLLKPTSNPAIPDVLNHNGQKLSGNAIPYAFNKMFSLKPQSSDGKNRNSYAQFLPVNAFSSTLFLSPTSPLEVFSSFSDISNSRSLDADGIQICSVKYVLDIISPVLTHIYNLILSTCIFPKQMQTSRVVPVFKHGDKGTLNNYRPISIIPVFSKGIEKLMHFRLLSFFHHHNLLQDFQHGFRKHRSTETALLTQKEIIIDAFSRQQMALGIYVDFSKAFDLIDHSILLDKLENYGVRGTAHALLKSYLSNRTQFVDTNNVTSGRKPVVVGVPQGSILGPLLFLIYINDIVNCTDNATFVSYADDTTVFITGNSESEITAVANKALSDLDAWASVNRLRINPLKTQVILYTTKGRTPTKKVDLFLTSQQLEMVDSVCTLGVHFSKHLTWNEQVNNLNSKLSSAIGILARVRRILPTKVKIMIYNALVSSLLQYCSLVWCTTGVTNLRKLHLLQKRAIRHIASVHYTSSTKHMFSVYEILPVFCLYNYRLMLCYKAFVRYGTDTIIKLAKLKGNTSVRLTRHKEMWAVSTPRTTYDEQSLSYNLPSLLNLLNQNDFDPPYNPNSLIKRFAQLNFFRE